MRKFTKLTFIFLFALTSLSAQECEPSQSAELNIGNVRAGFLNGADMFWNLNSSKYEVPKIDPESGLPSKHSIFSAGLQMGGYDTFGQLRVAAQTYRQSGTDYFPGPLYNFGGIEGSWCDDFDRIWMVDCGDIETQQQMLAEGTALVAGDLPDRIRNWPGRNNPHFDLFELPSDKDLAPFHDLDGDNIYDPLAGDVPRIIGDQAAWSVVNDAMGPHENSGGEPLFIQTRILAYAFAGEDDSDPIRNQTFLEIQLDNFGSTDLEDYYFSYFVDYDLGTFDDDYLGCIPDENLGFVYNGDDLDEGTNGYGTEIPVCGVKFMKGLVDANGLDLGLSHFTFYIGDWTDNSRPTNPLEFWYSFQNLNRIGEQYFNGGFNGDTPDYHFVGNPSEEWGNTECSLGNSPSDKRVISSSGPIYFPRESSQTVHLAVLWTPELEHPCPDVTPFIELGNEMENRVMSIINSDQPSLICSPNIVFSSVQEKPKDLSFTLYPNPTSESRIVLVNGTSLKPEWKWNLFASDGEQIVKQKSFESDGSIDLPKSLPAGIYLIGISDGDRILELKKLSVL